ncbi:MAG: hypothetical protein HY835_09245 [Anaerolineae bacterium]|nr:hypothetical protein [Anaerolineae bacterium]
MPISPTQFKNMNDLIVFLNDLEAKVNVLEEQNMILRNSLDEMADKNRGLVDFLKESWPKTSLFHRSFWVRALTVFGYNFVINLILSVILFILYLLLLAPMVASLLGQMPGLGQ